MFIASIFPQTYFIINVHFNLSFLYHTIISFAKRQPCGYEVNTFYTYCHCYQPILFDPKTRNSLRNKKVPLSKPKLAYGTSHFSNHSHTAIITSPTYSHKSFSASYLPLQQHHIAMHIAV